MKNFDMSALTTVIKKVLPKKSPRFVLLSGECLKCRKSSTCAVKMSDFWVEYCEDHKGKGVILNAETLPRTGRYVA